MSINIPRKWSILRTQSNEPDTYLFGADYSTTSFRYCIYLTDLNHVWISDVDQEKLEFKAIQNGIQRDSIGSVYEMLTKSFDMNFEGNDESQTVLELEKCKVDRGIPLELKLKMEKRFANNFKWNWIFELGILPDSSAITILKNMIFHMATVISSLNEYKSDLARQLLHKDSAIRFLNDSLDSMNASHVVQKWAPENSSNYASLQRFNQKQFDTAWRERKLPYLKGRHIWEVIDDNSTSGTWSYGTTFTMEKQEPSFSQSQAIKRPITNEFEALGEEEIPQKRTSPTKKRKVHMDNLNDDFENYDINELNVEKRKSMTPTTPSTDSTQTPQSQNEKAPTDKPKKRGFGISRKRKVQQKKFSPIKAPKLFHSQE